MNPARPLLEIEALSVTYPAGGQEFKALEDVNLTVMPGETVALIGESGSGKSTVALAVMGLLKGGRPSGTIRFKGENILSLSGPVLRRLRGRAVSLVGQDPFTSLNPSLRIGQQVAEGLMHHKRLDRAQGLERAVAALNEVGLPDPRAIASAYPHQLSGGMRQRVLIAAALICDPDLLILDEPTTALDVTVEARILDMVQAIAQRRQLGTLLITHNFGVVKRIADRVCVLYAGRVLEAGLKADVLERPAHPYTKGLLACLPKLGIRVVKERLQAIGGGFPDLTRPVVGCVFAPRCPFKEDGCLESQSLRPAGGVRAARCWKVQSLIHTSWPSYPVESEAGHLSDTGMLAASSLLSASGVSKTFILRSGLGALSWSRGIWGLPRLHATPVCVRALEDVSVEVGRGEVVEVVGESGSGKSTLGRVLLRLVQSSGGQVAFDGRHMTGLRERELGEFRRRAQIVFQNPASSLNPRRAVGDAVARAAMKSGAVSGPETRAHVESLFERVGLPRRYYGRYPNQLSGGEKQRVGIARALASRPDFIVCDEPVSALDVSVQATVLNLLLDLRKEFRLAYLFISHDLAVVGHVADRIVVLYRGRVVESGPTRAVLNPPFHPYTEALLAAAAGRNSGVRVAPGEHAFPTEGGCPFRDRCLYKLGPVCETQTPPSLEASPVHLIACHIPTEQLEALQKPVFQPASAEEATASYAHSDVR